MGIAKIARRTFLFGAAAVAGGVAFGYYSYRKPYANPLEGRLAEGEATFNPYLKIAADNAITIIAPRAEMGQGIHTTLASLVAEELDVTLDQITIEHGPESSAYFNSGGLSEGAPVPQFDRGWTAESLRATMGVLGKFIGLQFTGGSSSLADGYDKMRHAGAGARESLKAAAAAQWGVAVSSLKTEAGKVLHAASGREATYGALAAKAATIAPSGNIALRPRSEWKILGKPQPRKDMLAKVTGAAIFGVDVDLPDMVYATVRMNPSPGGSLKAFDDTNARTMRGVQKIVQINSPYGQGFAVIADNTWRAFQAADAVTADWGSGTAIPGNVEMEALLSKALGGGEFFTLRTVGDVHTAFADAPRESVIEAEYDAPFLSHAAMEPMNATARFKDGVLDVWAPNQSPTIIKAVAGRIPGIDADKVNVHTTFLGGGFGRRAEPDFSDYAIRLALLTQGRPVKVTWTREEDLSHGPYRPIAKARYKARLGADGLPVALAGSVAAPSVVANAVPRFYPDVPMGGPDNSLIDGAYNQPYGIANYQVDGRKVDVGVPVGFWRSVGYSYNTFMHESFIDEIAHAGKTDPLVLRRKLMAEHPAGLAVVEKVAVMSGWESPAPEGRARGMAFALSFGTWVAQVAEVSQSQAGIRIEKVWCAADPGLVLDPLNFKAQMMSGIIYGLSAAMMQEISFADGVVEQSNFHDYDAMRMNQCPDIEIELLENSEFMGGAGEPGTPPSMPALANALFALTGKRVRRLPLSREFTFA